MQTGDIVIFQKLLPENEPHASLADHFEFEWLNLELSDFIIEMSLRSNLLNKVAVEFRNLGNPEEVFSLVLSKSISQEKVTTNRV